MKKVWEGIYQIEVSLPEVGGVNIYFLDGDIPTLLDTGPNFPGVKDVLEESLKQVGRRLGDLRKIIVTHGHVDHYGLVGQIQQISGADVFMSLPEKEIMLDFQTGKEIERVAEGLVTWGVPDKLGGGILKYLEIIMSLGEEVTNATVQSVVHGEVLAVGQGNWQIQCYAGHSPAGLCLLNEDGLIFTGDHLLAKISPNPSLDLTKDRILQGGLGEYITSLKNMVSLTVQCCLPGHGPLIYNYQERIEGLFEGINNRRSRILAMIDEQPKSIFQVGQELLHSLERKLSVSQIWLAMKEVKAHLDLLERELTVKVDNFGVVNNYSLMKK